MSSEEWRPIPNFPSYKANRSGQVLGPSGRILKPRPYTRDYLYVCMWQNGKTHTKRLHRLIALTFIPNPENKPEVSHKDLNKNNNAVENLEWVTSSENTIHAKENGRGGAFLKGSKHPESKLKEQDVLDIIEGISDGFYHKDIAKYYGVSRHTITLIVRGETWGWLTGIKRRG